MAKTINELLGGTGTSPISTAFNVFKQYQTIMQSIEDRQYIKEQRAVKKEERMVSSVKNLGLGVQNAVKTGDIRTAKLLHNKYNKTLNINDLAIICSFGAGYSVGNVIVKKIA